MRHGRIGSDRFLGFDVDLYFHDLYRGAYSAGNTLAYLNVLKNDCRDYDALVGKCEDIAATVLAQDLEALSQAYGPLTICGVPRSKREDSYHPAKMGLKRAIRKAVAKTPGLFDGLDYIVRHTDTLCTHRSYWGHGGNGEAPRPGLLRDTCRLSREIAGKNIVLVDDIYTAGVGIDEDCVQALFDAGAKSVIMYTFGCTARRGYRRCA